MVMLVLITTLINFYYLGFIDIHGPSIVRPIVTHYYICVKIADHSSTDTLHIQSNLTSEHSIYDYYG